MPSPVSHVVWLKTEVAVKRKKILSFETEDVVKRVEISGDIFAPVLTLKQKLPPISALRGL